MKLKKPKKQMEQKETVDFKKIDFFWNWFAKNCKNFGKNFENSDLLNELDKIVSNLHSRISWEIGPGEIKENQLVISPNGNPDLLEFTKQVIYRAIPCDNWEYYYAKPPKQWELKFYFQNIKGNQIEVDASRWKYILLQYEDDMLGIIIESPNLKKMTEADKLAIAEICLDGILGEEKRMTLFATIDCVAKFDDDNQKKSNNIYELSNHLLSQTPTLRSL